MLTPSECGRPERKGAPVRFSADSRLLRQFNGEAFLSVFRIVRLIAFAAIIVLSAQVARVHLADGAEADMNALEAAIIQGPRLADLLAYAYRTNPTIKAAREDWRAKVERYRVDTAYPDPEVSSTYYPKPLMAEYEAMISQMIPFPGTLSQVGEVVKSEVQMARLELDKGLRDVIVGIRESYYELSYIEEAKKVVALNRDLVDHLRKVGETAYAQDRPALVDILKAQSQVAQLEYDALLLKDLESVEKARLNALLNRPPDAMIGPLALEPLRSPVYKLDEIYRLASQYQEEIRLAEVEINKARAKIGLAKYEYLPTFRAAVSYARGNPAMVSPEFIDSVGVQLGLTIPLWFGKNKGRLEEARAEEQKAISMKETQINQTNTMIRDLYFRLENSERLIRLYRDQLLPQAARSIEIAEIWYREKQGSFSDFVETEAVYYNFQLSLARAKADYGKYLARLERLTGRSLTEKSSSPSESNKGEGQ